MGRFSPTVMPSPSWTQGMAQGAGNLAQALMQRRQFNQQKLNQDRQFGLQQQEQDVRNAEAGYTPAGLQPNTPQGLSAIGNAGVSDASQPASYDPTHSLTYALLNNRNQAAMDRTSLQVEGRLGVADTRNQGWLARDANRFGTVDANGNYVPGIQTQSQEAVQTPRLDFQNQRLGQQNSQFQRTATETNRHNVAMENRPVGGGNRMSIGGGGASSPTTAEQSFIRQRQAKLQGVQSAPLLDPSTNTPTPFVNKVAGRLPGAAYQEAKHEVNLTRLGSGVAPSDTIPDAPATAPQSVTRNGAAASTIAPPPQGARTPLHSNGKANQHTTVTGPMPSSPTASNTDAYSALAKNYQDTADAIQKSGAKDKDARLATLRARYNAEVAKIGAPQQ